MLSCILSQTFPLNISVLIIFDCPYCVICRIYLRYHSDVLQSFVTLTVTDLGTRLLTPPGGHFPARPFFKFSYSSILSSPLSSAETKSRFQVTAHARSICARPVPWMDYVHTASAPWTDAGAVPTSARQLLHACAISAAP